MIFVVAKLTLKPGQSAVLLEVWSELAEEYRKEPGCIFYTVGRSINNQNLCYAIGQWESEEDYEQHLKGPSYQRAYAYSMGFLAKAPEFERCQIDI
ncbi:MAG: putative quinol monooxygenase [Syntrophomonadaceae bacterium]